MLRLPRVPSREARVGARARPRRHDDTITHGPGVPDARSPGKVLRRRPGSAHRGRPRHGRPPRHVRPRLHGEVLRGSGLSGPRQLLGELQRPGDAVRDRAADGLGGAQLLLQHGLRREQRLRHGRALVAPRRLRPAAGDERSRLRVVCVPGRHRPGERLADHAGPRAGVRARQLVLGRDRAPSDRRRRPRAHARDDLPSTHERAHEELRRVPRLLAAPLLRQRGRDRRVLGVPREGRGHGSLPAPQVGGARAGRRDPDPARDHPRRAPALGRTGHLHGALQRDGRDDRRRDGLPARVRTTSASSAATSTTGSG